jgi:dienelactone hydrolase
MTSPWYWRSAKALARIVLVAVTGIVVLLASMWVDHTRSTMLPTPTGRFAVGRSTYVWSDTARSELMAPEPGAKREVFAWIWYPATAQPPSQPVNHYLPDPWLSAVEQQRGKLNNKFLTRDLTRVRTHSYSDSQVSPQERSYPVILMRAGLAGLVTGNTSLAEDLASHGYVVAGFDAPYRSSVVVFPDGRVIARAPQNNADLFSGSEQEKLAAKLVEAWSADMSFALDRLEQLNESDPSGRFLGRLDLQRVGVFGHSLGGATALQFCHSDSRCKAGIDVDGAPLGAVIEEGVTQPFMFILSEHLQGGDTDAEGRRVVDNIRSIYDRLPSDRRVWITIRGANHFGFSDDGALFKSPLLMSGLRTIGLLPLNGRRQMELTAHYISTFFDVYLRGESASELKSQSRYPEVEDTQ